MLFLNLYLLYSLLNISICLSIKSFPKSLAISIPFVARFDIILPKVGMSRITPPNCTILEIEFLKVLC